MKRTQLGEDVLTILSACSISGSSVWLPGASPGAASTTRLDPKLYKRVNAALEALGGKWSRKVQAHVFSDSPADALDAAISSGYVVLPKDLGWFPTPAALAHELVRLADVRPGMTALEPSAGEGAIARELRAAGAHVHCIEIDPKRAATLRADGFDVVVSDFLATSSTSRFDCTVLNPPFGKRADVIHTRRAFSMLAPGGKLVAIMSGGIVFRQDKMAAEFRALVEASGGTIRELPEGSFVQSGTSVRTVVVTMRAAADASKL